MTDIQPAAGEVTGIVLTPTIYAWAESRPDLPSYAKFFADEEKYSAFDNLSPRRREFFDLLGQGHGVKEISRIRNISHRTAETYAAYLRQALVDNKGIVQVARLARYVNDIPQESLNPEKPLTKKEVEVLRLILDDKAHHEIADLLKISPRTVNIHVSHIYKKVNVSNMNQFVYRYG